MIVNGVEKPLPRPMTAQEYLEENGYQIARVAMERNGRDPAESILCRNDAGRRGYIGNRKFCRRWLIHE